MNRQFVNLHIIGGIFGVGPALNGVLSRVDDVLSVGASKIGAKGNIERVMDSGIGSLRGADGRRRRYVLRMGVHGWHWHVGTAHAEVWAHPLRPVTHVG